MLRYIACATMVVLLALGTAAGFAGDRRESARDGWIRETLADGGWKEAYDDGNCKIERKRDRDGGYQEKVECKRGPTVRPSVFYVPRQ